MVTMQNEHQASTTIYEPGSFVPMLRVDKQLKADERRAKEETRTYHIHCNYLGTPEALIETDSLQLVWQIELDPWGQTQREYNPNNMLQPIRMQGQQLDAETGLFYNRYRYYDPAGGRYVTQDPIGLAGGWHSYRYAENPVQWVDPLGLEAWVVGHLAGGPVGKLTSPNSYHMAILLDPKDKDCDLNGVKTLGGQPSGSFANGQLKSAPNYPGDSKGIVVKQLISTPQGMSDCDFLKELKKSAEKYCNCLTYSKPNLSLIPGESDGVMDPGTYNSNSYVSGVIENSGGTPPSLNTGGSWQAPGYGNPMPIKNYVEPIGKVFLK
jgi:RHS repeat-associated protein